MAERMSDDEVRLLGCADVSDASVALSTHNRMLAEIRRARESERNLLETLREIVADSRAVPMRAGEGTQMFREVSLSVINAAIQAIAAAGVDNG